MAREARVLDGLGQRVPRWLKKPFQHRKVLTRLADEAWDLAGKIAALDHRSAGVDLEPVELCRLLNAVRTQLLLAAPYVRCDCKGTGGCTRCHGKQWLSASQYLRESEPEPNA